MGLLIYAVNKGDAVLPFEAHEPTRRAADAAEREARGLDPYEPNPDYVEGAALSLSEGNFREVLEEMDMFLQRDMHLQPSGFYPIGDILNGCTRYLEVGSPTGMPADTRAWFVEVMGKLKKIAEVGLAHGATSLFAG